MSPERVKWAGIRMIISFLHVDVSRERIEEKLQTFDVKYRNMDSTKSSSTKTGEQGEIIEETYRIVWIVSFRK